MKHKKNFLSFLICFSLSFLFAQAQSKKVVIIGLDGLSVEGFKTAKHPNLDKLISDGVISFHTRSVMPSVTLPNWTSHLTSGGPEQHGVTSNSWTIDKHELEAIEKDEQGFYPSIFKILKDQNPAIKTAYYYNWGNLINSMNRKYLDEISFLDDYEYEANYDKAFNFMLRNKNNANLVFLYTVHTDHAGHDFKWMSPEYIKAIEDVDVTIGDFIADLKNAGLYEETNFLLITDHGGTRETGHGGLSMEEMEVPWVVTGPGIVKGKELQEPNSNANTAAVIAHLFNCKNLPKSCIGKVPMSIFE